MWGNDGRSDRMPTRAFLLAVEMDYLAIIHGGMGRG